MASNTEIKSLVDEITTLESSLSKNGTNESEGQRRALRAAVKKLGFALESPFETLDRTVLGSLYAAIVRIAIDLKLFEHLIEAGPKGMKTEELAHKTGADGVMLPRFLRSLTVIGLVSQVDKDHWTATPLTHVYTTAPLRSGYRFLYDLVGPVFQKMPEYLAKSQYRQPTANQGLFQHAWNTSLTGFEFAMEPQHADTLKDINLFMEGRRQGTASWLDFYPFQERILDDSDHDAHSVTLVDVGGGLGHGLVELRARLPNIHGRLILQDLPKTVQQAGDPKGVFEAMPHSFYDPQPIKGAKVYYIRQVLHDWPDKECRVILEHLAAVMRRGYSKILLNEFVVPEDEISEYLSSCDLVMMALTGGKERTKREWDGLVESAGLRIDRIWTLNERTENVLEVVLA